MTPYLHHHPGGMAMLRQGGKDATKAMLQVRMHSVSKTFMEETLQQHYIGDVAI
jgi:cytochrome b involved in lipid metabolism